MPIVAELKSGHSVVGIAAPVSWLHLLLIFSQALKM